MCSKRHIIIILLLVFIGSSNSINAEPSPTSEEKLEVTMPPADVATSVGSGSAVDSSSKKITLVLGGGGCRALAEIGVLKVFAENNIPINYIVGTSAGAIIGALYAANVPLKEIEKMAYDGTFQDKVSPNVFLYIIWSPFSKLIHLFGHKPYAGLTDGAPLEKFLRKKLPGNFSDLKIPFAAVATDLENGNTCMITTGDVCKAVVASSAVPVLVRPVTIGNTIFIDGGIKANLPTKCAQLTGADIIVAVPADAPVKTVAKRKFCSMRNLTSRVLDIMEAEIDKYRWQEANLVIYPKITDVPIFTKDPEIIKATIKAGEDAANAALPRLKTLLNQKSKTSSKSN